MLENVVATVLIEDGGDCARWIWYQLCQIEGSNVM